MTTDKYRYSISFTIRYVGIHLVQRALLFVFIILEYLKIHIGRNI